MVTLPWPLTWRCIRVKSVRDLTAGGFVRRPRPEDIDALPGCLRRQGGTLNGLIHLWGAHLGRDIQALLGALLRLRVIDADCDGGVVYWSPPWRRGRLRSELAARRRGDAEEG